MNSKSIMKILSCSAATILLCTLSLAGDDETNKFKILMTGNFHGSDVSYTDGELWYGLFNTDSGHVLEQVEITAKPWHDVIVDGPGDTTGISIRVKNTLKPTLLIKSPRKLQLGRKQSEQVKYTRIELGRLIRFDNNTLTAFGTVTDEGIRPPGDLLILDYRIALFSRHNRQLLVEYDRSSYESLPYVLWAGDLDGDEALDLLLDITNHYNVRHYVLYLSSQADANELVKLVAELRLVGG